MRSKGGGTTELLLNEQAQALILKALNRGDNIEIRRNRNGFVVYEVRKKIIYTNTNNSPASNGGLEEPIGVFTG